MRCFWIILCLCIALPASAQTEEPGFFDRLFRSDQADTDEEQGSLLEQLIEDQLSGAGRVVTVTGFEGALTGAATLDSLTIADDDGVWLTLKDAELDWNRGALFQGRIEVAKLTAGEILLPRLPGSQGTDQAPTPEAKGIQLPELPVSIQIDEISAARVALGAPVIGTEVEVSTEGALSLAGGEGTARLTITRLDGRGFVNLDASYSNGSKILALDLALEEDADGLLANLAGLPGRPSVDFGISGTAPIGDYAANLRLATDGEDRVTGQIGTFTVDETTGLTAQISGDVAPLFAPEYRPFFGDSIDLDLAGFRTEGGATVLKDLSLKARSITLEGNATLGPDMLPRRFILTGEIAESDGSPVLLPLAGEETRVNRVVLELAFDAAEGDGWAGRFDVEQFARGPVTARSANLRVLGQILQGATNKINADVTYRIADLDLGDARLRRAVGDDISGDAALDWEEGRDLRLSRLTLEGAAYGLNGNAVVATQEDSPIVTGQAALRANDLAVFSGLAERPLAGAANLDLTFTAAPLAGTFDITAAGDGQDIAVGDTRADAILSGPATLDFRATRDEDGLGLVLNTVETEQARLTGRARLTSGNSTLSLAGRLQDAGLLLDGLQGAVDIGLAGKEDADRDWDVTARMNGEIIAATGDGRLIDLYGTPRAEGTATARVSDLAVLSQLTERALAGSVELAATGSLAFDFSAFSLDGTLKGSGLKTGMTDVDRLLVGDTSLALVASGIDGRTELSRFMVETGALTASATGGLEPGDSTLEIAARLFDIAPFVAGLSGPAEITGRVSEPEDGIIDVDLTGTGPGGIRATVDGTVSQDFGTASLSISGGAPLDIANRYISPTTVAGPLRFDLRLNGPPALASLSGRLSAENMRVVVPDAKLALGGMSVSAELGGGRATLDLTGAVEGGGRVEVRGPIGLTAPYPANLSIALANARLADPRLFETRLNGTLAINGPLAGGAPISGDVFLGPTEIRIPSTGLGGAGAIPEITHINEPPPVRGTRRRAGLLDRAANGAGSSGPAYPLAVTIRAENRLFVRGRGLDSEFGGSLRLSGTTRNVIPSGGFDLIRGRLDILGQRLLLDEARISMEGSLVPRLFLLATTDVEDTSVSVTVTGRADNPEIVFSSAPELPQEEVLARLIFGRGLENLSALQAARLALAVRTLAGRGGEGIVSKLRSNTGLADLDVTTTEDGDAALRAGAYLNENLYTDVTVDSAGESQLNLNLDFTPSLTVKGGVSSDGGTSIGIFFERDY